MELQAAVAAVDGDAFEQVVEGRAPHLGQRIAGAFERQSVGYVLVNEGEPTEWMRGYGEQQGAAVRQMHQFLLRLDQRGEHPQALTLERAEINYFRQTATLAKPFQNLSERGLCGEPVFRQVPHRRERGIEESQPFVGTVYGDGRANALEHLGVSVDVPTQLGFCRLKISQIDGKTDRPAYPARDFADLEQPARTANHDMPAFARPSAVGQLPAFSEGQFDGCVESVRVGPVAV